MTQNNQRFLPWACLLILNTLMLDMSTLKSFSNSLTWFVSSSLRSMPLSDVASFTLAIMIFDALLCLSNISDIYSSQFISSKVDPETHIFEFLTPLFLLPPS
ncbi:hypothetical protein HHI36_006488 [Cryptolaemus montrouzieri]|uniref:Uncharacterized protein n=1 Tax=Cryptolaemus montrouzieri TaxID=559131 RepID=A0ABD2NYM8_9CUCU